MTTSCEMRRHVDDHFTGAIDVERERAMRSHLASCDGCRTHYRRRALLARLDPEAKSPEERLARGLGLEPRRAEVRPFARFAPRAAIVLALAASVLLFLRAPKDDGFASRGGSDTSATADAAGPRLHVHRVAGDGRTVPVVDSVKSGDELAFAYENPEGKPFLAIFAVDEHGQVYWFHPAWTDETQDPPAIEAETTPGVHELREAVRHRWRGSRIDVHALFLDKRLTVRQIEARLASLPLEGKDRIASFTVLP
jgi:hypothetical protein